MTYKILTIRDFCKRVHEESKEKFFNGYPNKWITIKLDHNCFVSSRINSVDMIQYRDNEIIMNLDRFFLTICPDRVILNKNEEGSFSNTVNYHFEVSSIFFGNCLYINDKAE